MIVFSIEIRSGLKNWIFLGAQFNHSLIEGASEF